MPSLIIDAQPEDIRVLASPLELQNRKKVQEGLAYNRQVTEGKKREGAKALERANEIGAEYIYDASTKTRTAPLEDRLRHYHPNQ
jgi:hypothetical protein